MIFGSIIRRAESAVEGVLDQVLIRIAVAVPLLIALGFATASASAFLVDRYGSEIGHLLMAAAYVLIAVIIAAFAVSRKSSSTAVSADDGTDAQTMTGESAGAERPLTSGEQELVNSMLSSAAPVAIPGLVRALLRNLPLVIAVLIALFVFSRSGNTSVEGAGEKSGVVPAE